MLRHFYDDFMSFVPLQHPQLLNVGTMEELLFYSDYVLLTFPLANAIDIEEVMDMMEDDMQLIMLYHHIPSQHTLFGHSACAYSNPLTSSLKKL